MNDAPRPDFARADGHKLADLLAAGLTDPSAAPAEDSTSPSTPPADRSSAVCMAIPGYEIQREIGRGGMGCVYAAAQLSTRRTVALKVLPEGPFSTETSKRRFEREVRIAAALRHANIAQVYESGLHEGRYWFSMELVEGRPLDAYVEAAGLTFAQRLQLLTTVCEAVGFAHGRGVVHRDLKPGNILVSDDGQPRILDFGLAKVEDPQRDHEVTLSVPGELLGTPAYMSPEQTARQPRSVDACSDVYSLGVILYRVLTGRFPYDVRGRLDEVIHAIATAPPTPPSQVSRAIDDETEAIILKALAKDPADRYASARLLAEDLGRRLSGAPVLAKLPSRRYRLTKTVVRQRKMLSAVGLLIVVVAASVVVTQAVIARRSPATTQPVGAAHPVSPASAMTPSAQQPLPELLPVLIEGSEKARMPVANKDFATAWLDGKLHVLGGGDAESGARNNHFVYDPGIDQWATGTPMRTPRRHHAAAAAQGRIYVLGGDTDGWGRWTDSMEAYDPATDAWADCPPYPGGVTMDQVAAAVGGKVYVTGGLIPVAMHGDAQKSPPNQQTYVYDPAADTWSAAAPFPELPGDPWATLHRSAAVLGNLMYVIARQTGPAEKFRESLCAYDTVSGLWRDCSTVPFRLPLEPVLLTIGDLVAVTFTADVEGHARLYFYSPARDTWYQGNTGTLSYGGWSNRSVAGCADGFFVLGGNKRSEWTDRVEYLSCTAALAALAERYPAVAQDEVLLEETFAHAGPLGDPWQIAGGSWNVEQNALHVREAEWYVWSHALYPATEWTDYALECDFRHESALLAVLFRYDAARGAFYELVLQHEERDENCHDSAHARFDRAYFPDKDDLRAWPASLTLRQSDYSVSRSEDHRLRVEVQATTMRAYIDGVCVLTAEDTEPEPPLLGGIGFGASTACFQPCVATIRNLRVVKLGR